MHSPYRVTTMETSQIARSFAGYKQGSRIRTLSFLMGKVNTDSKTFERVILC